MKSDKLDEIFRLRSDRILSTDPLRKVDNRMEVVDEAAPVRLITITEAASFLHVHPNTLRKWCDRGLVPCYRIGMRGDRRFTMELMATLPSILAERGQQNVF